MTTLRVQVPASTANLGAGFDCLGIALAWYDQLELELTGEGLSVEVSGQGEAQVPLDETHLVVKSLLQGLQHWGVPRPAGMRLRAYNQIPHSRGLGSSAAAIVAGLGFAWGICFGDKPLDLAELGRLASYLEGHPDNAGAAVLGGACLGVGPTDAAELVGLELHPELQFRVWVPDFEVPTLGARSVLPAAVPRADAVAQAASAALLPVALQQRPDLLWQATADRLHQVYRRELMQPSWELLTRLRELGVPATVSGAGPTIFAIGTAGQLAAADELVATGFQRHSPMLGAGLQLML